MRDYIRAGPRRLLGTVAEALRDPVEIALPGVLAPTLVVRGDRDPIAPQEWIEAMVALLSHARIAVVPGAGHAANYSAPGRLAGLIETFIAGPAAV